MNFENIIKKEELRAMIESYWKSLPYLNFLTFLENLKRNDNISLIESIKSGVYAILEDTGIDKGMYIGALNHKFIKKAGGREIWPYEKVNEAVSEYYKSQKEKGVEKVEYPEELKTQMYFTVIKLSINWMVDALSKFISPQTVKEPLDIFEKGVQKLAYETLLSPDGVDVINNYNGLTKFTTYVTGAAKGGAGKIGPRILGIALDTLGIKMHQWTPGNQLPIEILMDRDENGNILSYDIRYPKRLYRPGSYDKEGNKTDPKIISNKNISQIPFERTIPREAVGEFNKFIKYANQRQLNDPIKSLKTLTPKSGIDRNIILNALKIPAELINVPPDQLEVADYWKPIHTLTGELATDVIKNTSEETSDKQRETKEPGKRSTELSYGDITDKKGMGSTASKLEKEENITVFKKIAEKLMNRKEKSFTNNVVSSMIDEYFNNVTNVNSPDFGELMEKYMLLSYAKKYPNDTNIEKIANSGNSKEMGEYLENDIYNLEKTKPVDSNLPEEAKDSINNRRSWLSNEKKKIRNTMEKLTGTEMREYLKQSPETQKYTEADVLGESVKK